MSGKTYNRVKQNVSGSPGTGTVTLGTAISNYLTFSGGGVEAGAVTAILEEGGTKFEVCDAEYDPVAGTVRRIEVYRSTAALVGGVPQLETFTSAATIGITVAAEDIDFAFAMAMAR